MSNHNADSVKNNYQLRSHLDTLKLSRIFNESTEIIVILTFGLMIILNNPIFINHSTKN